jgi:tetratricopeptide (TPR) repeat protein
MVNEKWSDAADHSLRLAREHGADPTSPAAMSLAVRISRELDRAADGTDAAARARLEAAIELAIAAFPEHPDQPLWQLERQTLAIEAKAQGRACKLSDKDPAVQAPADATTEWLRARRAAALAWLRLRDGDATGAMAALDASNTALSGASASRRLAVRVAVLAELDRDVGADAELRAAATASPALLSQHTVDRMRALLPAEQLPLKPSATAAPDAAAARRLRDALEMVQCKDAASWTLAGDLLRLRGEPQAALVAYERALATAPDAREVLLGKAEALFTLGGEQRLAEAMGLHRRLLAGNEMSGDAAQRDRAWWISQLRQLQALQAANRFDERAVMRVNRLKALDASLGGPAFAEAFAALPSVAAPAGAPSQP